MPRSTTPALLVSSSSLHYRKKKKNKADICWHQYIDYASAAGILCGAWEVESTTASDLPQATKALADILGGGAPKAQATGEAAGESNATTQTSSQQAKDAAPVKNRAPAPTGRFARSFGGAAVAAAAMHL